MLSPPPPPHRSYLPVPAVSSEGEGTRGTRGDSFEAETIAHKDKDDGCKELGTDCGGRSGENVKEELLAATEAVWRIAEMAREVLEGELDRRGEALATARRVAKEAGEACSKQVSLALILTLSPREGEGGRGGKGGGQFSMC